MRWLLWPLEQLYAALMRARAAAYERGWLRSQRLPAKVISIGNLTVGGTGKTPLVLRLAAGLRQRGTQVAILTRGYGRRERLPLVINGQGEVSRYTPELMGDEPILLARHLPDVTIGIGEDRFAVAQKILAMEAPRPPQVFLLDDGFQHLHLARDLDLVLIDVTDPLGEGAVLPAGRLREPLEALRRADMIVFTRAHNSVPPEVVAAVRRWNPQAPAFRAVTRLSGVFDAASHRPANLFVLKQQPALAFCGLGNPEAFWDDLRRDGFNLAATLAFADHHRYGIEDFRHIIRLADRAGARVLLTTEKDLINLTVVPPSLPPTFYCRMELVLDDEAGFFAAVAERLEASAA
ncbi:MAG: tetraacyldisaccharide 4'-kinase [Acidobacteria bacterium]|nr:tetraacyldisaccharide 4'-kinase [Acidobacteriota bacterium]